MYRFFKMIGSKTTADKKNSDYFGNYLKNMIFYKINDIFLSRFSNIAFKANFIHFLHLPVL